MELKDFVAQAIGQISEGILEAQKSNPKTIVNPPLNRGKENGVYSISTQNIFSYATNLSFDISVSVQQSKKIEGKGEIKVLAINLDGEAHGENRNQSVSRIQFEIPIVFPRGQLESR